MHILVTGARGFIGSSFIRYTLTNSFDCKITAFCRDTNQLTKLRLEENRHIKEAGSRQFQLHYGDLLGDISGLCEGIDIVVNFAAKTFVDHSIRDPKPFFDTNMIGTLRLIEEARRQGVNKFIQISTDEVYGQILEGCYDESAPINPRNPYAASKAAADALVMSYTHTYGMWTAITRTENNYGYYQHPQKAIPVFVKAAMQGLDIPVYGDGKHVRQWIEVRDHVRAIWHIIKRSADLPAGEVWHVAGNEEITNLDLATRIIDLLKGNKSQVKLIDDRNIRPGHDRRYAISSAKLKQIGWSPKISFDDGLKDCVDWYYNNSASWLGVKWGG